jgi:peptidoglycan/LPS O-acetylase OafA/YrhL
MSHFGAVSASPKYHALDAYRFVAAAGVVALHYGVDFDLLKDAGRTPASSLAAMVDFFFLLSGFVIAVSYRDRMADASDYGAFLKARVARIYPLHVATFAIMALAAFAAWRLSVPINHPEQLAPDGILPSLSLVQAWGVIDHNAFNAPSWSLSAEAFVYLLTPLCFWAARRAPTAALLALAAVLWAAIEMARAQAGMRPLAQATYDQGMLRALPSYVAGVALGFGAPALTQAARAGARWARWSVAHALGAALAGAMWLMAPTPVLTALFGAMVAVAAACEGAGQPSFLRSKPLKMLGDASFALYLLHPIAFVPTAFVARRLGWVDGGWGSAALALGLACLVVLLAIACHRWFERPAQRWALSLGRPDKQARPVPAE